jgi:hypothetical protein
MNHVPYPAGTSNGLGGAAHRPMPWSVAIAVKFMYAGAALGIVGAVISVIRIGALARAMASADGYPMSRAHALAVQHTLPFVAGGLIGCGLWLWMARTNAFGLEWARIAATVLFAANTLGTVALLTVAHSDSVVGLLGWVVGLATCACLWRRDASLYFAGSWRDAAQLGSRYYG